MAKKNIKRMLLAAVCCIICFVMVIFSSPTLIFATETSSGENASGTSSTETASDKDDDAYQQQLSDLQEQQSAIIKQQNELNDKINAAKDEINKKKVLANTIDEQISITKDSIRVCEEKIDLMSARITQKEQSITRKESDIENNMQLFRDRMRAIYMTGGYSDAANSLIMLLSSNSVTEFLTRNEFLGRIADHDEEMVEDLRSELAVLETEKAEVVEAKTELEAEKAELDAKTEELGVSLSAAQSSIQDLSAMQAEYKENFEELSAISKQIQSEITDIYKTLGTSSGAYVGGEMMWPVPGFSNITCYYGWRFNNTDFHTGIDISGGGVYGASVVAANAGTVVYTNYCPYNGYKYGYGTYIILDHGGGITTLYGHLSNISVSVGDIVAMGDTIGNVGNTGWSTGAHLHFEVRKDGSAVNPLPYVS